MVYLNAEMQRNLDIYSVNNQEYLRCLIRRLEIAIAGRPEELVRQLFIHYLINESTLLQNRINIKVEANNHDIEIYKKELNYSFKPYQPPLIIVEVKREDVSLQNHHAQIKRYLTNARCNIGILYNYHKIILFNKKDNDFEINELKNFKEVEQLILKESVITDCNLLEFNKAQKGDFESFAFLISKYGKYTTNTIVFKLRNQPLELKGYFFKVQGNKVYYDPCGQFANMQQCFDCQDFEKLVSITY
jgi:hypothetical protein